MNRQKTIAMRQTKLKQAVLEQLKRTPILEAACDKAGINRTTLYRWTKVSKQFAQKVETALVEGRFFISDIAESQVLALIKAGKMDAIRFWLTNNSPRYANKLELSGSVNAEVELSTKQKALIRKALKLSIFKEHEKE